MNRQEMAARRAETIQSLRVERLIVPWPYSNPWVEPDRATVEVQARHASQMYGAAMRGRLKEFINEAEGLEQ